MAANICVDDPGAFSVEDDGTLTIHRCGDAAHKAWPYEANLRLTDNGLNEDDTCGMWVAPHRTVMRFSNTQAKTPGGDLNAEGASIESITSDIIITNPSATLPMFLNLNLRTEWRAATDDNCFLLMKWALQRDAGPFNYRDIASWFRPNDFTTTLGWVGTFSEFSGANLLPGQTATFKMKARLSLEKKIAAGDNPHVSLDNVNFFLDAFGISIITGGDI